MDDGLRGQEHPISSTNFSASTAILAKRRYFDGNLSHPQACHGILLQQMSTYCKNVYSSNFLTLQMIDYEGRGDGC